MALKGSQTEKNLMAAFAGESQARNRYTYFAGVARKENFVQIAAIFEETANQEKEHAKRFFKFLEGGECEVVATYPAGGIGDTLSNLQEAAGGEKMEWGTLYPSFAKTARSEGFADVARAFELIAVAEKQHEKRYATLAANIKGGKVFKRETQVTWQCRNCGYVHSGKEALQQCPACLHPQSYFELICENW